MLILIGTCKECFAWAITNQKAAIYINLSFEFYAQDKKN